MKGRQKSIKMKEKRKEGNKCRRKQGMKER
jgi:hypothetical protein